jgi:hypothetical protein
MGEQRTGVKCTECGNGLIFGGMSRGLGMSKDAGMEMMAQQLGYEKKADGWKCRAHK